MKKLLLSALVIFTFGVYVFHRDSEGDEAGPVIPPQSINQSTSGDNSTPQPSSRTQTIYKNGEYIGDITDAFYGNIQVKVIIRQGQVSDVQFLDYPSDRTTSIRINHQAMPYLKSEAISAQSANVDIVTGATQSSEAFIKSLQSALDRAKS